MKTESFKKYQELIHSISEDKHEAFFSGALVVSPENENVDYQMKLSAGSDLDLFCQDRNKVITRPNIWVTYPEYLRLKAQHERNLETARLHAEFKKDLLTSIRAEGYCINDKQFEVIFQKAYEEEHSSGYGSVADAFRELLDFVEEVQDAALEEKK